MSESAPRPSFLKKITKKEVAIICGLLGAVPAYRAARSVLSENPLAPASFGIMAPVILNALGTSIGTAIIGKSISGASVRTPSIMMKGLIGIIICEANLIFSLLSFCFLKEKSEAVTSRSGLTRESIQDVWTIFCSGLVCGMCGLIASIGGAVVNAASSIAIASNSKVFSKLVTLQLIVSSVGALGLVVSLFFLKLCSS